MPVKLVEKNVGTIWSTVNDNKTKVLNMKDFGRKVYKFDVI